MELFVKKNSASELETRKSDLLEFEIEDDVEYELDQCRDEIEDFGPNGKFEIKKTRIPDADIGIVSSTNQQFVKKKIQVGGKNQVAHIPFKPVTLPTMDMNVN